MSVLLSTACLLIFSILKIFNGRFWVKSQDKNNGFADHGQNACLPKKPQVQSVSTFCQSSLPSYLACLRFAPESTNDLSVEQPHDAMGDGGVMLVVSNHDDGGSLAIEFGE